MFGFCELDVVGVAGNPVGVPVIVQFHIIVALVLYTEASIKLSQAGAHWLPIVGLKSANGLGYTVIVFIIVSVQGNPPLPPACTTSCTWYVWIFVLEVLVNI